MIGKVDMGGLGRQRSLQFRAVQVVVIVQLVRQGYVDPTAFHSICIHPCRVYSFNLTR